MALCLASSSSSSLFRLASSWASRRPLCSEWKILATFLDPQWCPRWLCLKHGQWWLRVKGIVNSRTKPMYLRASKHTPFPCVQLLPTQFCQKYAKWPWFLVGTDMFPEHNNLGDFWFALILLGRKFPRPRDNQFHLASAVTWSFEATSNLNWFVESNWLSTI